VTNFLSATLLKDLPSGKPAPHAKPCNQKYDTPVTLFKLVRALSLCLASLVATTAFLLLPCTTQAKEVPPKPNTLVNDFAAVLAPEQAFALEQKLRAYADSTSTQIAILIERSLEDDEVFEYSFRVAEAWGIGNREKDNGILFYVAVDDRKMFVHTGMGVQDYLTDNVTKRILDQVVRPAFRNGDYYGGLDRATSIFMDLGSGRYVNDAPRSDGPAISPFFVLLIIIAVIAFIGFIGNSGRGGGGGYHRGGRYDSGGGGWFILPGGGWGGGGGGGNDSDWGGFGGGGFDGGGAGGDW